MSTANEADTADAHAADAHATGEPAAGEAAAPGGAASGGAASGGAASSGAAAGEVSVTRVWRNLNALVLEQNQGRKKIVEALGMSFFRAKALRRIAAQPSSMSELATRLASDRPYLTLVVDDLEKRGLVERRQHPTDRRCKIVSVTEAGQVAADRANAILGTPPPALESLAPDDLATLDRILAQLAGDGSRPGE